jgi:hypothetical protein
MMLAFLLTGRPRGSAADRHYRRLLLRGVTALEFALVAPLVIVVIFFSLEMGIIMWADSALEAAAARVSRIGQLGVPADMTCEDAVRGTFESRMSSWVYNKNDLHVDATIYRPGASNELPDFDDDGYVPVCNTGGRGDMIIYRLGFDRPGFTGIMSWLGIPVLRFERTIVIQNEP